MNNPAATPQSNPIKGNVDVTSKVIEDLEARAKFGEGKYGTRLMTNNGRDSLLDAYQEILDLAVYIKQHLLEKGI